MNFTMTIHIVDGQVQGVTFDNVSQNVTIMASMQAIDAAKAFLGSLVVAQPAAAAPPPGAAAPPPGAAAPPPGAAAPPIDA